MKRQSSRVMNLNKAAGYTIGINALQILGALTVTAFSIFSGGHAFSGLWEQALLAAMTLVVCWGAALDIREAFSARKLADETDMLEDAYAKLEQLNGTLRAQRHDFMNHLQVVYSLLELEDYRSAEEYIEQVYGDIKQVSRSLKTAHPAINALLAAKLSDCEARGVRAELLVESPWNALPVPGWEMCRVLGNLIDNALDALKGMPDAHLTIRLGETLQSFTFEIVNNGPEIPSELAERIFASGFSTKSSGRGMGLSIVRTIMHAYGGRIELKSDAGSTAFSGVIGKSAPVRESESGAKG